MFGNQKLSALFKILQTSLSGFYLLSKIAEYE